MKQNTLPRLSAFLWSDQSRIPARPKQKTRRGRVGSLQQNTLNPLYSCFVPARAVFLLQTETRPGEGGGSLLQQTTLPLLLFCWSDQARIPARNKKRTRRGGEGFLKPNTLPPPILFFCWSDWGRISARIKKGPGGGRLLIAENHPPPVIILVRPGKYCWQDVFALVNYYFVCFC